MGFNPVWANSIEIGISATSATPPVWTYAPLCKGIEGMTFNSNEQNQQFFFLCGEGFAHNEVTGGAPELQITGRRIVGDLYGNLGEKCNLLFYSYCKINSVKSELDGSFHVPPQFTCAVSVNLPFLSTIEPKNLHFTVLQLSFEK